MENKETWKEVLEIIKLSVSSATFSTWFSQTHLVSAREAGERMIAEVGCTTFYTKNTIETRYFGLIQDSLSKVLGKSTDILFVVKENPDIVKSVKDQLSPLFEKQEEEDGVFKESIQKAKIRPSFTFENFAVSSSNQMAHAAAEAVSQTLGSAYNPLFIWGGVGVGKTHLMVSVGNYSLKKNSNLKVLFCTGEDFTNDIVE